MSHARRFALFLAGALIVGPAPALTQAQLPQQPRREVTILLTDAQIAECQSGSGCDLFQIDRLAHHVRQNMLAAYQAGHAAGQALSCKGT